MLIPFIVLTAGLAVVVAICFPRSRYLWSLTASFGGALSAVHLLFEYSDRVGTVPLAVGMGAACTVSMVGSVSAIIPHLARPDDAGGRYSGFWKLGRRMKMRVLAVVSLPGLVVALPWLSSGCLRLLSMTVVDGELLVDMGHTVYLTTSTVAIVFALACLLTTARPLTPAVQEEQADSEQDDSQNSG